MKLIYLAIITALIFTSLLCIHLSNKVLKLASDSTSNELNLVCEALLKNMAALEIVPLRVRGPVELRPKIHGGAGE